jgi:hypothetical protein
VRVPVFACFQPPLTNCVVQRGLPDRRNCRGFLARKGELLSPPPFTPAALRWQSGALVGPLDRSTALVIWSTKLARVANALCAFVLPTLYDGTPVIFTEAHWGIFATQIVVEFDHQRPQRARGQSDPIARCTQATPRCGAFLPLDKQGPDRLRCRGSAASAAPSSLQRRPRMIA